MTAVAQEARRARAGRLASAAPACATFYYTVGGNDVYWRMRAPAKVLGAKLAPIPEKQAERVFTHPNTLSRLPWRLEVDLLDGDTKTITTRVGWDDFAKQRPRYLAMRALFQCHEGVAVFSRPDPPRAVLGMAMKNEHGTRLVGEVDDNYFTDASKNLYLRHHGADEDMRDAHAKAHASMDAIVFSTEALRDTYRRELRRRLGKRAVPELYVARNCVPRSDWPERDEGNGRIRVGFMGSNSHVWDVNLAYAAFHAANKIGCETVTIGYNPGDPDPGTPDVIDTPDGPVRLRSEKSADFADSWRRVINTKPIPWITPGRYRRAALPLDIGLCPLRVDSFTLGKSDIKAVEYTISGAAVVAQNMPVYTSAGWRHEVNCLLAGSPEEFARATLRLATDQKLRFELVSAAQEMVWNERNEDTLRAEWRAALNG